MKFNNKKYNDKNKNEVKTQNYDDIIFSDWKKEHNTNCISTKDNDYPTMSYCMWMNTKNYVQRCSTNNINDNNNINSINNNNNNSNNNEKNKYKNNSTRSIGEQKLKIKNIKIY